MYSNFKRNQKERDGQILWGILIWLLWGCQMIQEIGSWVTKVELCH